MIFSRKIETLMHIIKGNIGAGILAFPYALSKAGLLVRFPPFLCISFFFLSFSIITVWTDCILDYGNHDTLLYASTSSMS